MEFPSFQKSIFLPKRSRLMFAALQVMHSGTLAQISLKDLFNFSAKCVNSCFFSLNYYSFYVDFTHCVSCWVVPFKFTKCILCKGAGCRSNGPGKMHHFFFVKAFSSYFYGGIFLRLFNYADEMDALFSSELCVSYYSMVSWEYQFWAWPTTSKRLHSGLDARKSHEFT